MAYDAEGHYIPKSYEFERDLDGDGLYATSVTARIRGVEFDEKSNIDFYAMDEDEILRAMGDEDKPLLVEFLNIFLTKQVPRLDVLYGYSRGENYTILHDKRRADSSAEKSDKRVAHNWGGYISNFATSFMISKPVTITYLENEEEVEETTETDIIQTINKSNRADRTNYDLALDASICGRAFEILHYNREEEVQYRFTRIDPREAFVIRSADLERKPLAGVYCPVYNGQMRLIVFTRTSRIEYKPFDINAEQFELEVNSIVMHEFDGVPLIEWRNSRDRMGDFETEISLIDAYDSAQSDSVNYMNDFNDALLVIANVDIEAVQGNNMSVRQMMDANMLILEGQRGGYAGEGNVAKPTAEYIYKRYDATGSEANKDRLLEDLFQLSGIPDLDALNMNRQTNEGLQNKYIGVKQLMYRKEQYFSEALRERYRLIASIRKKNQESFYDADALVFRFRENKPMDIWGEIESYVRVGGIVSQETLRENTNFTTHEQELLRTIRESKSNISPELYAMQERMITEGEQTPLEEEVSEIANDTSDKQSVQELVR